MAVRLAARRGGFRLDMATDTDTSLRSLYICYLSLEDPLVLTQVVAYLEGLAERGHTIHLLTFEPRLAAGRRRALRTDLRRRGIVWHALRYHKRPSLPATLYDALAGAVVVTWLVLRHRLDAVHARSHVPAASALIARRLTGRQLIFDIRGLMAEEYADAGRWRREGVAYRITDAMQAAAIRAADGIVVLTERVRDHLFGGQLPPRTYVIPCCASVDALAEDRAEAEAVRGALGIGDRPVMVYVGKLAPRYMEREMVEFFTAARDVWPSLLFLVLTQSSSDSLRTEFARRGIPQADYRITRAAPQHLGAHLATANFAICFYRPTFSEIAASPTKVGEYLVAGLPVVSGPGVGDTDAILTEQGVGVIAGSFTMEGYEASAREICRLASEPGCRERCRAVGRDRFSLREVGIPRYDALYREVAAMARPDR